MAEAAASGGTADHLGGHGVEVSGEPWAVSVVEEIAQVDVLLHGVLALDRALPGLAQLLALLLGLGASGELAVGPAVDVAERLRDPL